MTTRSKVAVQGMGGTWVLTEKRYAEWLAAHALGAHPDLDDFGEYIGETQRVIDDTPEDAFNRLKQRLWSQLPKRTREALNEAYQKEGARG